MKRMSLSTALQNCKKNSLLLFSTIAALCLFLSPSLTSLMLTFTIFAAVTVTAALDLARPTTIPARNSQLISTLLTVLIAYMGFGTFNTTWTPSSNVAALAGTLGTTTHTLLLIIGAVCCIVGAYAMYILGCWIVLWTVKLSKERLLVQDKTKIKENLKRNWYFPISAMAFFCLNATLTLGYFVGLLIVFMISLVVASQNPSLFNFAKKNRKWLYVVAIMTALGICWGGQSSFYADWSVSSKAQALEVLLPIPVDIPGVVSVFGAVVALFFVYICVLVFWKEMSKIISDNGIFDDINIPERIVYSILIVVLTTLVVFSFTQTEAFYGTEYAYDIIYTSDSPSLVKDKQRAE